jgi:DNA-binding GntR family transcriptional regulator
MAAGRLPRNGGRASTVSGTADRSHNGREPLSASAYDAILGEIIGVIRKPGDALTVEPLALSLGMSRTPVREALQRLEAAGFVESVPGKGFVVAELSLKEVKDMLGVLVALDAESVGLAAKTPAVHARLLAAAKDLDRAERAGDLDAWRNADARFHAALLDGTSNAFLKQLVTNIRRRLHRITINSPTRPERILDCTREHGEIARAVASGDSERARTVMREHHARMHEAVISLLEKFIIPFAGERF